MDVIAIGLIIWSRVLLRRPGAPAWLRWVAPVLVLGFVVSLVGTVLGLQWVFHATEDVPASQKAQVLAVSISRVMLLTLVGLVLDVLALIALVVVTVRKR